MHTACLTTHLCCRGPPCVPAAQCPRSTITCTSEIKMPASTQHVVQIPDAEINVHGTDHRQQQDLQSQGQPDNQQGHRFKSGQKQPQLESAASAFEHGTLGFAFGGSGFLVAYEIGVAERLRELGIITARTPVSGTSASALVAVAIACDIDFDDMLQALEEAGQDLLDNGALGRFRTVLSDAIDKLLPKDAHLVMLSNKAQIFLAATRTKGPCPTCWHPTVLPCDFSSSEEIKRMLLTVAHLPIYSDMHLVAKFRHRWYIDGGIRSPVVILPTSVASRVVRVYALPAKFLNRVFPYKVLQHPPKPDEIDIAPDQFGPWPYKYRKSSRMALRPQGKPMLDALRERGRQDAQRWAHQAGLLSGHADADALPPMKRTVVPEWQHLLLSKPAA